MTNKPECLSLASLCRIVWCNFLGPFVKYKENEVLWIRSLAYLQITDYPSEMARRNALAFCRGVASDENKFFNLDPSTQTSANYRPPSLDGKRKGLSAPLTYAAQHAASRWRSITLAGIILIVRLSYLATSSQVSSGGSLQIFEYWSFALNKQHHQESPNNPNKFGGRKEKNRVTRDVMWRHVTHMLLYLSQTQK